MTPPTEPTDALPPAAYTVLSPRLVRASALTRGPWDPQHQHAGPPIAMVCRAIEAVAQEHGLGHIARLTANLLRPVPITELEIEVSTDYAGRNAAHYSARLWGAGKELARFTALAQRESETPLPAALDGHPLPQAPLPPADSAPIRMPFNQRIGYADLVENRVASGHFFGGRCAAWFRLRHPLVAGEAASGYQRVAVAADSGNGISAVLDFAQYSFVNSDLSIHLLRRPVGEWVCVDARTLLAPNGCGLAESQLFDELGLIGRAAQSLAVRARG
ncbi:thioesterase family protein [Aquabacterium sp. OR-4]|uniref:thioesterase family protein n=1 Tax=Aquabacterium sp. OR-4 TaxID=2978127 RepID=UPI0021B4484E|nr:thioesterase family protein [Aquabacterium sp. OR-4]MDT7835819.1 thioesterase family protein [Aquabacterium sp. OR-4]